MSKDNRQHEDFLYKLRPEWNFYLNEEIMKCTTPSEKNIGYLIESKTVIEGVYVDFILNWEKIIDNFKYIFVNYINFTNYHPKIKWAPASFIWIDEPKIYNKSKLISMITSKKSGMFEYDRRLLFADKMIDTGLVDIYGNGFNYISNKEEGLCDYMFSIAMENARYPGNFTEKIMDCFATGTIPIYSGDPKIDRIFNPKGIINLSDDFHPSQVNEDIYYEKMDAIKENLEIVKQFSSIQDWIHEKYLKELE
jgi:hypothetical protein